MKIWYKKYRQAKEISLKNLTLQWLTVFFLIFAPITMADNTFVGPTLDTSHERLAEHISRKWKIDYRLAVGYVDLAAKHQAPSGFPSKVDILAVAQVESNFRERAKDPTSPSVGLMQIHIKAHNVSKAAMETASLNIEKGAEILKQYRAKVKSDSAALVAYNAGPGGMAIVCENRNPCTSTYSQKVQRAKWELQQALRS